MAKKRDSANLCTRKAEVAAANVPEESREG